jgi:hypothetical protein
LRAVARAGRVAGVNLSHLGFRLLTFLLSQRPGYWAHHETIAGCLESNLTSVRRALGELLAAGLVTWKRIPPHHVLPTGRYTRTNVNQYFVCVERIPVDSKSQLAGQKGPGLGVAKTVASTHPNSGASTGRDPKFELDPPLSPKPQALELLGTSSEEEGFQKIRELSAPPSAAYPYGVSPRATPGPSARERRSAARAVRRESRVTAGPTLEEPGELGPVVEAWRKLKLGDVDERSLRALVNRRTEGASVEQLCAAVTGAGESEWLRQGRAKVPFAVVFASLASVQRFAAEGVKHAAERASRRERDVVRAHRERVARDEPLRPIDAEGLAAARRALGIP